MNFRKEIKEIKEGKKECIGSGYSRYAYESNCKKFVIKQVRDECYRRHNESEFKLWKKTKSFLLNPIVWRSKDFEFIAQPKLEVIRQDMFFFSETKQAKLMKKEICKMFGVKSWFQVQDFDRKFDYELPPKGNSFIKELYQLYQLGFPCDDLHLGNWGRDILGRLVLIDYSTAN